MSRCPWRQNSQMKRLTSGRSGQDVLLRNTRDRFVTVHTYLRSGADRHEFGLGLGFCAAALTILYVLVLVVCHVTSI